MQDNFTDGGQVDQFETPSNVDRAPLQNPKSKTLTIVAIILGLVFLMLVVYILWQANNNAKNNPSNIPATTNTPSITGTPLFTSTPILTDNPEGTGTNPSATPSTVNNPSGTNTKTATSVSFNYSFNYPQDWILYEIQGDPMGGTITSEGGYMGTENNSIVFEWEVNDVMADGGEVDQTIMVKGKSVPLEISKNSGQTTYSFQGADTVLSIDIPKVTRFNFDYIVKDTENQNAALQTLVSMLESLNVK